jgi:hypothetical protein
LDKNILASVELETFANSCGRTKKKLLIIKIFGEGPHNAWESTNWNFLIDSQKVAEMVHKNIMLGEFKFFF